MLYEIVCDKFKMKKILFNDGLNTILGTNEGDNSIGKSSILLIIDFVFGGNTYAKSEDIIKNIGDHKIKFAFKFDDNMYYFYREIIDSSVIHVCDEKYNDEKVITLVKYCEWLGKKYNFLVNHTTFRKEISRYIRVYGKNNADEKNPLHGFSGEKTEDAMNELLKIFNYYEPLNEILEKYNISNNTLKAYKEAQKYEFVSNIKKNEYNQNIKEIKKIDSELNELVKNLDKGLIDMEAAISEEAVEIKNKLSAARRMKSRAKVRKDKYDENSEYKFSKFTSNFDDLVDFFPNVNLKKIEEIELFHKNISKIFKKEIRAEIKKTQLEIMEYDNLIKEYEKCLQELIDDPNLSKQILKRHSELKRKKDELESKNKAYKKLNELKDNRLLDKKRVTAIKTKQLSLLSQKINNEMDKLNNIIYGDEKNAPKLNFSTNSYNFITPDNTGTGIAYKGLVIFDISVLNLTNLPIIVHDSFILKQISDGAIEKILELYIESGKQVIIAFDKQDSYTKKTQELLEKSRVLSLGPNGNELFGKSWG